MVVNNIHEAKTNLSKLLTLVQQNEEVIIAKAGVPIAKIVSYSATAKRGGLGVLKGKVWISKDFDKPSKEIEQLFYGD